MLEITKGKLSVKFDTKIKAPNCKRNINGRSRSRWRIYQYSRVACHKIQRGNADSREEGMEISCSRVT